MVLNTRELILLAVLILTKPNKLEQFVSMGTINLINGVPRETSITCKYLSCFMLNNRIRFNPIQMDYSLMFFALI